MKEFAAQKKHVPYIHDGGVFFSYSRFSFFLPAFFSLILFIRSAVADQADEHLFLASWNCLKNRTIQSLKKGPKAFLIPAVQFLIVSAFISFYVVPSHAGLDAPHNSTNGISCENCHDVTSNLSQMMPAMTYTPQDIDDTPFNALCWSCHNDGTATFEDTHSSIQTDNDYGPWTVECRVCHNQHTQDQAKKYGSTYGKLIRTDIDLAKIGGGVTDINGDPVPLTGKKQVKFLGVIGPNSFADGDITYDGICEVCHTQTLHFCNDDSLPDEGSHAGYAGTNCMNCHKHKAGFKGSGHEKTQFAWAGGCENCHGAGAAAEAVVAGIHGNKCNLCHTTGGPYDASTNKVGDNGDGDATLAEGDAGTWASTCVTCHNKAQVPGFHGLTIADVVLSHQLSSDSSGGYDCEACHTVNIANEQLVTHMNGTDTPAQCAVICHRNTIPSGTSAIVAKTVIDDVTFNDPAPNNNDSNCEDCHDAKGDFKLHGLSDDDSVADGIDDGTGGVVWHNNLGGSRGAWADSGGTIPSNRAASYSGKIDQDIYGGLLDDDYNCADCHAADHTSLTSLEAMRVHTFMQGSGGGNCLTCHNASMVADEIDTGKGVGGTTIECEDCHSLANGNGPSGEKMYQYDGVRHHKTMHAQAGNCTRCHADPRPADLSAEPGFAGTAAINDSENAPDGITWNDGFKEDYGMVHPEPIPTQMACRLCHTNYETYTVNVRAEIDNDWDTTDLTDKHGYNKTPPVHGLTIYADNYDARGTELTYLDKNYDGPSEDDAQKIRGAQQTRQVSLASHRIDANDQSSKIEVYNYGACLACHTVQLRHAAPVPGQDYDIPACCSGPPYPCVTTQAQRNTHPFDALRYAPGKSVFNDFKGSTGGDAWNDHSKDGLTWLADAEEAGSGLRAYLFFISGPSDWYYDSIGNYSANSLVAVPVDTRANQFENLPGLTTPYNIRNFDNGPAAPVFDDIIITVAEWTGSWVYVEATSSIGPAQNFSFTYTGAGGPCNTAMIWDTDHYEGTCNAASGWTGPDTVTVSNTTTSVPSNKTRVVVASTTTIAVSDSYVVPVSTTTQLLVLSNDPGLNNEIISLDDTLLDANCTVLVVEAPPSSDRIDITCGAATGAMGTFDYVVQGNLNSDTGSVTITASVNLPPTITINEPDGSGDTFPLGTASFDTNFTLADSDSVATVSLYYDTDTLNYDGVAIGSCADLAEGTANCAWNISALDVGAYYVYGITDSPDNAPVYSACSGALTITGNQPPVANDDGTYVVLNNSIANFQVLANDMDGGDGFSLSVIAVGDDSCGGIPSIGASGLSVDYVAPATGQTGCTFTYTVSDTINTDQGMVTVDVNQPPTITVNQPDGYTDSGSVGGSYTIDYDVNDTAGDAISVDFFYDDDNSGEDGTPIASCQNLTTKGAGLTCNWTSLPAGTFWFVYGVVGDGDTTTTDYSPGAVVVSNTPQFCETFTGGTETGPVGTNFNWTSGDFDIVTPCDPWKTEINGTFSGGTGPSTWENQPYAYIETTVGDPCTVVADDRYYLQSPALNASSTDFYLTFDYNSTSTDAAPDIEVWYRNGTGGTWTKHGANVMTGPNNAWATETARDFSAELNSDDSAIRIVVRTSSASFRQDVAIDNIYLNDTP